MKEESVFVATGWRFFHKTGGRHTAVRSAPGGPEEAVGAEQRQRCCEHYS
jgi:hypothetical protein